MGNYLRLLAFLKDHKRVFTIAVIAMFVAGLMEVFSFSMLVPLIDIVFTGKQVVAPPQAPAFLHHVIEQLNNYDKKKLMPVILAGFFIMIFVKNFLIFVYQYFMGDVSQRVMRDIRARLYNKIQNLSLDYFTKKRTGELISRITHDTNLIENAVSYGVTDLFRQPFMMLFWIATAFTIDPIAAFCIFIIFPFIGYPMSQIGRRLKKISRGIQEKMADINSLLLETISGIQVVKAFCTEGYESNRFKDRNHSYYKLRMQSIKRIILISPLTEIIANALGIILVMIFVKRFEVGELSLGVFILFFAAFMNVISPIKKLGNVNALTQQALAANTRIYEILNEKPTVKEGELVLKELSRSIRIEKVDFHYYQESGLVLKDIDLEIKKGELIAIVGPTGTGKTTLVNLIPRFYDPTRGRVTFDGVDLRDVTFKSLRAQIGIVTQETILFNDTVRANIAYGNMDASQHDIELAAQRAFAHQFIVNMPEHYNTTIGDRGFRLSGGEKQRISIARAILKNPPILILDEATSQLDSESEKYVQEALDKLMLGRTVIAIAHRLSTIKKADKIIVLEQGRIVGLGTHEQLMTNCPLYEKLHRMQFQT